MLPMCGGEGRGACEQAGMEQRCVGAMMLHPLSPPRPVLGPPLGLLIQTSHRGLQPESVLPPQLFLWISNKSTAPPMETPSDGKAKRNRPDPGSPILGRDLKISEQGILASLLAPCTRKRNKSFKPPTVGIWDTFSN